MSVASQRLSRRGSKVAIQTQQLTLEMPKIGVRPGTANSIRSMRTAKRAEGVEESQPEAKLADKYIANLQQQVYFLELQLKLLKEKRDQGQATPAEVAAVEARFKEQIEEIKTDNDRLEIEKKRTVKECERWYEEANVVATKYDALRAAYESQKSLWMASELKYKAQLGDLEAKVAEQASLYATLLQQTRSGKTDVANNSDRVGEELLQTQEKLSRLQQQDAANQEKLRLLQIKLVEVADADSNVARANQLNDSLLNAQSEKQVLEDQCTKLKIQLQNSDALRKANEDVITALHADLTTLRTERDQLRNDAAQAKRELSDNERRGTQWSHTIVELRAECKRHQDALSDLPKEAETLRARVGVLHEELVRAQNAAEDKEEERLLAASRESKAQQELAQLRDLHHKASAELSVASETIAKLTAELNSLKEGTDTVKAQRDELLVQNHQLQSKLDVSKRVEHLDLDKFQTMMKSNMEMQQTIQMLMGSVNKLAEAPVSTSSVTPAPTVDSALPPRLFPSLRLSELPSAADQQTNLQSHQSSKVEIAPQEEEGTKKLALTWGKQTQ